MLPILRVASFTLLFRFPASRAVTGTSPQTQTNFTRLSPHGAPRPPRPLYPHHQRRRPPRGPRLQRDGGVRREGQEIFNAVGRTLPTRWSEQSTVILDAVFFGSRIGFRVAIRVHAQGQGHGQDRDSRARSVVLGRWRV